MESKAFSERDALNGCIKALSAGQWAIVVVALVVLLFSFSPDVAEQYDQALRELHSLHDLNESGGFDRIRTRMMQVGAGQGVVLKHSGDVSVIPSLQSHVIAEIVGVLNVQGVTWARRQSVFEMLPNDFDRCRIDQSLQDLNDYLVFTRSHRVFLPNLNEFDPIMYRLLHNKYGDMERPPLVHIIVQPGPPASVTFMFGYSEDSYSDVELDEITADRLDGDWCSMPSTRPLSFFEEELRQRSLLIDSHYEEVPVLFPALKRVWKEVSSLNYREAMPVLEQRTMEAREAQSVEVLGLEISGAPVFVIPSATLLGILLYCGFHVRTLFEVGPKADPHGMALRMWIGRHAIARAGRFTIVVALPLAAQFSLLIRAANSGESELVILSLILVTGSVIAAFGLAMSLERLSRRYSGALKKAVPVVS